MLSEEGLILVGALGACGLLVLGVLELLWPTRPRRPVRRRVATTVSARAAAGLARPAERVPPAVTPYPARRLSPAAHASPAALGPPVTIELTAAAPLLVVAAEPFEAPALARAERAPRTIAAVHPESVVERCFALHEARRHPEVVVLGLAALQGRDGVEPPAGEGATAALWSVIALARQAMGEDDQARAALEGAIAIAPPGDRPAYQRQLAALADGVAARLLAEADQHVRPESEDRLAAVRDATGWLQRGAAAMPSDTRLAELAADTEARLWSTYERTVMALAQRQDFRAARRLLREALDDPRFPAGRVEAFHDLFSGTFSGEIGQLTAQAIRSVQDAREADALGALQRAETLLGTLSAEALPPTRREEVGRRLWWGYSKLGERRVAAGEYEAALDPLFNALGYDVGPERRQHTRALLVRALDGVAGTRAVDIQGLADAGDRQAAIVRCDRLDALLRGAADKGLTPDDLDGAFGKVQRLVETLGR